VLGGFLMLRMSMLSSAVAVEYVEFQSPPSTAATPLSWLRKLSISL
jgi:hypothetical protein